MKREQAANVTATQLHPRHTVGPSLFILHFVAPILHDWKIPLFSNSLTNQYSLWIAFKITTNVIQQLANIARCNIIFAMLKNTEKLFLLKNL